MSTSSSEPAGPLPAGSAGPPPEAIKAIPVRHWGRWVSAAIVLLIVASLVRSVVTNDRFEWNVVGDYLFDPRVMDGVVLTIEITIAAMVAGVLIGVLLAVMRLSPNPLVAAVAGFYVWIFRGTPVLVQLLFWNFIAALYPEIDLGIPFIAPDLISLDANTFITPFVVALLGLGLNEGAYMAEIVRAGVLSVDEGQTHASQALGMTRLQTMRRIVLPQAMRVIIPPTGNETISMLKTTSLVSVIAYAELLYASQLIYSENYRTIQLLIVASIWYLVMTTVLTIGQAWLERRFGRGTRREAPLTPWQRIVRVLVPRHADPATIPQRAPEGGGGGGGGG
ncbi:amino acid ABC transporter permease [Conexibacter woesei]|uniref:Polar amino acid ABC transporter, inner membrane subunit n=1 Tax=Conexibacter woesei (strain DSM 14684 / CCUG 47730 / CIP 108061 / JCM 11494 / NBRC 100937 / ID131577) TaxID=469383 RepID=D3F455_CONWI|nr:polar amino acid ABC transporter, inner membrane subunit [Conexibacter woesei DSM 14684]